jgi:hypothetical protein
MGEHVTDSVSDKRMKLRYAGVCRLCGVDIPAQQEGIYERATRTVRCVTCPAPGTSTGDEVENDSTTCKSVSEQGVAGSSARREYERRKAADERRLREKWGRLGGVAVALSNEKQTTTAWKRGAVGEELLGARLDSIQSDEIAVLHDLRIPRSKANIDHIVITSGGVWVIDAKRYKGRPELRVEGGILRPRVEKLVVGRRDCTKLVDGVLNQSQLVRHVVGGDVPVRAALCFVEADWPLIGGAFATRDVEVLWPKRLAKLLSTPCEGDVDVSGLRGVLTAHFPRA